MIEKPDTWQPIGSVAARIVAQVEEMRKREKAAQRQESKREDA